MLSPSNQKALLIRITICRSKYQGVNWAAVKCSLIIIVEATFRIKLSEQRAGIYD